jgi:PTS system mannose-specific IIA component
MVGILILTHGNLARELLASARTIAGELSDFQALALEWEEEIDEARGQVEAAIRHLDHGDGVLILTDVYGGTPSNVAMSLRSPGRVEVVAGVNLPMVVRLGCQAGKDGMSVSEMAAWIRDKGKTSIFCSSDPAADAAPTPKIESCEDLREEPGPTTDKEPTETEKERV